MSNCPENLNDQPNSIQTMTADDFYEELTISSSKFISKEVQENFRDCRILVVGVGSIGNPIAMCAVRSGSENITVMDPDNIETNNLSRQEYLFSQVGTNKAETTALNMTHINPYAKETIKSVNEGMTIENAKIYVENSDIVIDAVDIRSLDVIWELHKWASILRKPVLVGYDLAGSAMIAVYRYDQEDIQPLKGELFQEKIDEFLFVREAYHLNSISESQFLNYIYDAFTGPINPLKVPVEQLEEILNRNPDETRTYQIGTTSRVLSALTIETIRRILANEDLKDTIVVDLPAEVRRNNPTFLSKIPLLLRTLSVMTKRGREVKNTLSDIS